MQADLYTKVKGSLVDGEAGKVDHDKTGIYFKSRVKVKAF